MRNLLEEILSHHTGQDIERIRKDSDRDFIMSAAESQEYGVIDEVLTNRDARRGGHGRRGELSRQGSGRGGEPVAKFGDGGTC